jgi:hypothetical protein
MVMVEKALRRNPPAVWVEKLGTVATSSRKSRNQKSYTDKIGRAVPAEPPTCGGHGPPYAFYAL